MKYLGLIVALFGLALAAAVGFVYSGWYNVGADVPDNGIVRWVLHTTMERSVARRAAKVGAAPELNNPALIRIGAEHYREMCVQCHLAPGVESTEIRTGLNPQPPTLETAVEHMNDQSLFWVIKHGVRMTAMPAWGKTHSDRKIWAMVAFLKRLPGMTAEEFHALAGREADSPATHDHEHEDE